MDDVVDAFLELVDMMDENDLEENDDVGGLLPFVLVGEEEQPHFPRFSLEDDKWTNKRCRENFRFDRDDIYVLAQLLEMPEVMRAPNRSTWSGLDGLCLVLRRLSYPNRLLELVPDFGRAEQELSMIFNSTCEWIYDRWSHLLSDLQKPWLLPPLLEELCQAVQNKGAPLQNCWGFVDGTPKQICRPTIGQRVFFSGHKRYHCIKFQTVGLPNGIIVHLSGPYEGRIHDANMLRQSGLLPQLEEHMDRPQEYGGGVYSIYGDPAYPIRAHLIAPYPTANITAEQRLFNTHMSKVRQSVEWQIGKVIQQFAFLDFSKDLKILLQPVAKLYIVGALLTNCHTCLYGSETGSYFNCAPPSLEEYLQH